MLKIIEMQICNWKYNSVLLNCLDIRIMKPRVSEAAEQTVSNNNNYELNIILKS